MNLPETLSIGTALIFGILSVFLSFKEEKTKRQLTDSEKKNARKFYHIEILSQIQNRIGYSLDIERVIDVIIGSLGDLFPYTSASSLSIKDGRIIFKTYLKESANENFVDQVKKSMLASLSALLKRDIQLVDQDFITGKPFDQSSQITPRSFFHIPFVVNGEVEGLISVASARGRIYQESDMTMLYQITSQASDMLSKLENVLNTEQEKLIAMIKSLVDGVFMVDTSSKILVINSAAKRMMGLTLENPTLIDVLSALPQEIELAHLITSTINNNKYLEKTDIFLRKRILDIFIIPVTASNKVLGASVVIHDKTLETNLAQAKEDFTNMVVHELKAPIVAIKGASELIEAPDKLTTNEILKLSHLIYEQSENLLLEISSILDAAKIESGRFTLNKNPADLNELILNKIRLFQPEAVRRGIKLLVQAVRLPIISIDESRINNVLNNLISNSLKFTPSGKTITISTELTNTEVKVKVADTGIGIPKDKQKNLFSKYSYSESPISSHIQIGTGLGLYIVKEIIKAHGGRVLLESEESKGTTVSLILPLREDYQS